MHFIEREREYKNLNKWGKKKGLKKKKKQNMKGKMGEKCTHTQKK